jgi:hypothetical protein
MSVAENAFATVSAPAVAAALRAAATLPAPAPVHAVDYVSAGRTLIVGPADIALDWAERLKDRLDVSVLITEARGNEALPPRGDYPVWAGRDVQVNGWLGAYTVRWSGAGIAERGEIGALDFSSASKGETRCDLVFDLSRTALIRLPHPC